MKAKVAASTAAEQPFLPFKVQFVVDAKGRKTHAQLDIRTFERLVEELEMAEDVRAYREVMARNEPTLSWEEHQAQMADNSVAVCPDA